MKMFIFFVIILLSSCKSNTSHNNSIDNLIFSKDMTLDEFRSGYLLDTDCQPIGQRLDTEVVGKKEGIIGSILDGQE